MLVYKFKENIVGIQTGNSPEMGQCGNFQNMVISNIL